VGVAYGLAAYLFWGFVPVYFKAVAHVAALEVLAHRVVWSVVLLAILLRISGSWRSLAGAMGSRRTVLTLLGTTTLIATNWFVFIWTVAHNQVLQASLGYFINPLVNVLLGMVFLRERLRPWQTFSVLLATAGVGYQTWQLGTLPAVALLLAFTFGFYGLLRKTAPVEAVVGLTVETFLLVPLALVYLGYLWRDGALCFGHASWQTNVLLPLGGVVTAVPLLWFTHAARRLRMATLGFLQYLAPSLQFLLAVAAYDEPFTRTHMVSFACIWTALAIYSTSTALQGR